MDHQTYILHIQGTVTSSPNVSPDCAQEDGGWKVITQGTLNRDQKGFALIYIYMDSVCWHDLYRCLSIPL